MKKKIKFDFSKLNKATDETHPETLENKYKPVNTNSSASDKIDFLDSLAKDSRKDSFINILVKEALKANQMNNITLKLLTLLELAEYHLNHSEFDEFKEATLEGDREHMEDEMGDILFAVVNLSSLISASSKSWYKQGDGDPQTVIKKAVEKVYN